MDQVMSMMGISLANHLSAVHQCVEPSLFPVRAALAPANHSIDDGWSYHRVNKAGRRRIDGVPLPHPIFACALDGHLLGSCSCTRLLCECTCQGHIQKPTSFYSYLWLLLIMGYPLLRHHNPYIDWTAWVIRVWRTSFQKLCVVQLSTPPCATILPSFTSVMWISWSR